MNGTTGRVVLITGSSSGIGAATARLLASRGLRVVVNYLNSAAAAEKVVADAAITAVAAELEVPAGFTAAEFYHTAAKS